MSEYSAECQEANRIAEKLRGAYRQIEQKRPRLTPKQVQVLLFCRDFLNRNDEFPPMWAISKHFGWASANAAKEHVDALGRHGAVERNEIGNWRFVRVAIKPEALHACHA